MTAHPTAEWTAQQFREAIPSKHRYRFLIHDRDSIFSAEFDNELARGFRLTVLRTPLKSPQANAHCERLVGTVRRECLDFLIPLTEKHLRRLLHEWVRHYNGGRPHRSLGPGIPDQGRGPTKTTGSNRHLCVGSFSLPTGDFTDTLCRGAQNSDAHPWPLSVF